MSFKELVLESVKLSKTKIREMDGISKKAESIRTFLIGQVGKNYGVSNNPIRLGDILEEVYAIISAARILIGGRIIILECEDNMPLIQLYQAHHFSLIEAAGEEQPRFRTMYTHIAG